MDLQIEDIDDSFTVTRFSIIRRQGRNVSSDRLDVNCGHAHDLGYIMGPGRRSNSRYELAEMVRRRSRKGQIDDRDYGSLYVTFT